MTEHPAKEAGCTKRQIEVFEHIAIGDCYPKCSKRLLEALIAKGLVMSEKVIHSKDRLGILYVIQYYVPLHIHHQWCCWAAENSKEEEHDGS